MGEPSSSAGAQKALEVRRKPLLKRIERWHVGIGYMALPGAFALAAWYLTDCGVI